MNQVRQELAKRKLINFTTYTKPNYQVNWHHENLAEKLDQLSRKEIKRLMVFMPPRYGKSELVSRRFPAYVLGKYPNASIIGTSYSASLASSMNRDVQRIIDSREYNDVFPDTSLSGSNIRTVAGGNYLRNSDIFEVVGHTGSYMSAGIGGGITGRGGDYVIIDDPIKNRAEAESKTYRDAVWDWYTSTLYTRLEKDACVLLTLTRWHEDDLAGRLLRLAKEDPTSEQWHIINYPAMYDENIPNIDPTDPRTHGDALWPAKFDKDTLLTTKKTVGTYEWSALYQQSPSPSGGSILHRKWFQYYTFAPTKFDEVLQSWDLSFGNTKGKSSSYIVGQVWGRIGPDKYLLDQVRDQLDFPQTIRAIKNLTKKWPQAKAKLIENKANGPAVISTLKKQMAGIIPVEPDGSKEARAYAISPQVESGNVYVPENEPWVHDFIEECVSFPNGLYDDQVDTMTQALNRMSNHNKPKPTVKVRSM